MRDDPKTLVSTEWLAAHLNDPDLRILDASLHMAATGRDARAEYEAAHIPGARFFDIDAISDSRSELPHMAPPPELFVSRLRAMGIGDGHQVVVYDNADIHSAARVWWLFRLMGKTDVAVLDGGFAKWQAEGREVEDMAPITRDRHMTELGEQYPVYGLAGHKGYSTKAHLDAVRQHGASEIHRYTYANVAAAHAEWAAKKSPEGPT